MDRQTIILYTILGIMAIILGLIFGIIDFKYYTAKCEKIVSDSNQYYEAVADCYMVLEQPQIYLTIQFIGYILLMMFSFAFLVMIKNVFFEELFE